MTTSLTVSLILALGLIHPICMSLSAHPEDLEGSGYEWDGSGSGDSSDQGEMENIIHQPNSKGTKNTLHNFEDIYKDGESGFVIVENSKSLLENKEIVAAVITGGVIGAAIAVLLGAVLIYMWKKKDTKGYIPGQQQASDYHGGDREVVVV
ncbi:uncharacterized protein ACO6RY_09692 [Pungitius sinensis]